MVPIPIDLKGLIADWCKHTEPIDTPIHLSEKEIRKESRKIFDKLVIRIIKNKIDNQILADEILKLQRNERIVITLNIVEEMTPAEIAELLGINTNNVYVQKNKGLNKLRKQLEERNFKHRR